MHFVNVYYYPAGYPVNQRKWRDTVYKPDILCISSIDNDKIRCNTINFLYISFNSRFAQGNRILMRSK